MEIVLVKELKLRLTNLTHLHVNYLLLIQPLAEIPKRNSSKYKVPNNL